MEEFDPKEKKVIFVFVIVVLLIALYFSTNDSSSQLFHPQPLESEEPQAPRSYESYL